MLALLDYVADQGPPRNAMVSHIVDRDAGIWEFIKGRVRVLWFYDEGRRLVFSHGFQKKTQRTPPVELTAARQVQQDYFKARKVGDLRILEEE